MPITMGRNFTPAEFTVAASEPGPHCSNASISQTAVAAVVNESFVRTYFPQENPIGQRFGGGENLEYPDPNHCKDPGWQIVGVVHDAKYNDLRREVHPTFYVPSGEDGTFELRTASDPRVVISAVRDVLRRSGFDLPLYDIKTESQQIDELLFQERLIARLSSSLVCWRFCSRASVFMACSPMRLHAARARSASAWRWARSRATCFAAWWDMGLHWPQSASPSARPHHLA